MHYLLLKMNKNYNKQKPNDKQITIANLKISNAYQHKKRDRNHSSRPLESLTP